MKRVLCILVLLSCAANAENLLSNPGFDNADVSGFPKGWDVFVMPMDGAEGRLDTVRHDGEYAAMLYTPEAYAKEPINNWSQIVYDDLVGKKLWATGTLRVEEATEAAIWLQCFRKNPLRVVASSSTRSEYPIYGTQGWTTVRTSVTVPPNTDFVVVRCVLIGTGRAWFDTLLVSTDESEHIVPGDTPEFDAIEPEPSDDNPAVRRKNDPSLEDLLQLTLDMQNTIQRMESNNDSLVSRIEEIRRELEVYRNELSGNQDVLDAIEPLTETRHPLVPYGYYQQEH
jgi:hypothetical protein